MKKKLIEQRSFPAAETSVHDLLHYAIKILRQQHIQEELLTEYRLVLEEAALKLIERSSSLSEITVESFWRLNEKVLRLSCPGEPITLGAENQKDLGGKILEEYRDYLSVTYLSGVNYVEFSSPVGKFNIANLISIALGFICWGILSAFCSKEQLDSVYTQFLSPIISFYAGMMQTLASPVVLFSTSALVIHLVRKFAHNKWLLETFASYLFSSVIAILIGAVVVISLPLPDSFFNISSYRTGNNLAASYGSLKGFIEMFTFTNILQIFETSNPIPVLIIALLLGTAATMLHGPEGNSIRNSILSLNGVFAKMLNIAYEAIPLVLFFATLSNLIAQQWSFAEDMLILILLFIPLAALMMLFYFLELALSGMSPLRFCREYGKVLWENFLIGSNRKAIPYNQRILSRKTALSLTSIREQLTLGAMVNMDGNCLIVSAYAVLFATACGVTLTPGFILVLILLLVGAPDQPGSFLIGMIYIMGMIGLSAGLFDMVIVGEALLGSAYSFLNTIGDVVHVAAAAAKAERELKK